MKVNAGILIDFGNSETRMTLLSGGKSNTYILSNRFAILPAGYTVPAEYNNDKSNILCVGGVYYANGYLADREFEGQLLRPSAVQGKYEQLVTEISLNLVFIKALTELAKENNIGVNEIEASFNMSVLLPPLEHDTHINEMRKLIKGVTSVVSYLPLSFESKFKIEKLKILPEGVAAFFGVAFAEEDGNLVEVPENKEYCSGNVMIIDIGAGTTDIVLIKDTELVLDSKDTFSIGGNTVEAQITKYIRKQYGYTPTDISKIVNSGELQDGATVIDVSEIVTQAKSSYSKMLKTQIVSYLERMMMSMREIKGVLVVGGGALPTIRDGKVVSPAMSDVLVDYLKELSPNVAMISIDGKNARMLNIEGLELIHKFA